mmetsp:Transcript_11506/g.18785  ORF Transcript_11506/g.18785 Transcript_11506/m.18785 type:complete len:392 (+) Transcript_11506:75-1250(+)
MKASKTKRGTIDCEKMERKGRASKALGKGVSNKENKGVSDVLPEAPVTPQKTLPVSQPASATKLPSGSKSIRQNNGKVSIPLFEDEEPNKSACMLESESRVKKIYKIVQKSTGALGGNGYNGAIYGELTLHSMQKVIDFMVDKCEMGVNSMFIDVGSGLGKPNFHACQDPGVRVSIGIELEEIRWQLAMQNLKTVLKETRDNATSPASPASTSERIDHHLYPGVNFIHGDIFDVVSTDPFTHIYMYDLGFPPPLQQKIAEYFNNSTHATYLVSYRPPRRVIGEYGYEVEEIGKMPTSMTGSGESHTAYFYKRTNSPAPLKARAGVSMLQVPPRESSHPEISEVVCSNYFRHSIELALGPVDELSEHVEKVSNKILNSGRPKRERKSRNLNL